MASTNIDASLPILITCCLVSCFVVLRCSLVVFWCILYYLLAFMTSVVSPCLVFSLSLSLSLSLSSPLCCDRGSTFSAESSLVQGLLRILDALEYGSGHPPFANSSGISLAHWKSDLEFLTSFKSRGLDEINGS